VWEFTEPFFSRTLECMIDRKEIEKLAGLARIEIKDSEKDKLKEDINEILIFVEQIKGAHASMKEDSAKEPIRNVMREDEKPHETGLYTKDIVNEFPKKEGNYLKVKNIL